MGHIEEVGLLQPQTPHTGALKMGEGVSWKLPELPSHLSTVEWQHLWHLLLEYQDLFALHDGDLGHTQVIQHQIHTEGGPVWVPFHHQNPHVRQEEEWQVKQMLDHGIIHPP